mmetsp:Transcript_5201/g.13482  ORF Transcript_5201/g.13482 Transcript_5201/m.13482 type:complete len:294 (-) Transcript_5201:825-1706(-)
MLRKGQGQGRRRRARRHDRGLPGVRGQAPRRNPRGAGKTRPAARPPDPLGFRHVPRQEPRRHLRTGRQLGPQHRVGRPPRTGNHGHRLEEDRRLAVVPKDRGFFARRLHPRHPHRLGPHRRFHPGSFQHREPCHHRRLQVARLHPRLARLAHQPAPRLLATDSSQHCERSHPHLCQAPHELQIRGRYRRPGGQVEGCLHGAAGLYQLLLQFGSGRRDFEYFAHRFGRGQHHRPHREADPHPVLLHDEVHHQQHVHFDARLAFAIPAVHLAAAHCGHHWHHDYPATRETQFLFE